MKINLVNGPIAGYIFEDKVPESIDLLDTVSGKVRRYRRNNTAVFIKEWASQKERDEEVLGDNSSRAGQRGEDDPGAGDSKAVTGDQ